MKIIKFIKAYFVGLIWKLCREDTQLEDIQRNYSKYTVGYSRKKM